MNKSDVEDKISNIKDGIQEVLIDMSDLEVDPDDYEKEYILSLNEFGPVKIGSFEYNPAFVLRKVDETAYNNGLSDFVSDIPVNETEEYKDLAEELEELENELEELENMLV